MQVLQKISVHDVQFNHSIHYPFQIPSSHSSRKKKMAEVGKAVPSATIYFKSDKGIETVDAHEALSKGKNIVFGIPGAFTPTCTAQHVPGFEKHYDEIKQKGVDNVYCVAVNDAFVMEAWAQSMGAEKVTMWSDGNGEWTKKLGIELDGSGKGLGLRCKRFAMIVKDGVIEAFDVEQPGAFEVSKAEVVMTKL
uniref:Thioredoxin domain-containing protein n=1 Tax=Palpitomonas bilix TaxID=652834 RepID=A0A7S3D348_9EUKA|mmetsp:Transcript_19563/g.50129  ORF Transcript_19563/g.50129 Transcript_19563/m.50129 type:complete len:193 (+) Transcript_19563:301-879(+)